MILSFDLNFELLILGFSGLFRTNYLVSISNEDLRSFCEDYCLISGLFSLCLCEDDSAFKFLPNLYDYGFEVLLY